MNPLSKFRDETEAWNQIRALYPWDLLIHVGTHVLEMEHRCRRVLDELGQVPSVRISRRSPGSPEHIANDKNQHVTVPYLVTTWFVNGRVVAECDITTLKRDGFVQTKIFDEGLKAISNILI